MHTISHDLQKSENWHVALSTASNTLLVKPRDFRTFAAVCTVFSQYVVAISTFGGGLCVRHAVRAMFTGRLKTNVILR